MKKVFTFFFLCYTICIPDTAFGVQSFEEVSYLFNTLFLLCCGVLVMFMAAGFTMLESGMVGSKSVGVVLTKNVALYSVAGIMYYLIGYNMMYTEVNGGFIGSLGLWNANDMSAVSGNFSLGYASAANWFFQMVFVATSASIVSGALAERIRVWPFLIFVVVLTGIIYPIAGSWKWGGGWLNVIGFVDCAGATLVHSVGGWAALIGALKLGARRARYNDRGDFVHIYPSSLPQATLGTFILWLGWLGFNSGSKLAFGNALHAIEVSSVFINTNASAVGGVIFVMIACQLYYKKLNLPLVLNGALAGLVSITSDPLSPHISLAFLIGGVGGIVVMITSALLERMKIDDAVSAIAVHLGAGIWGTIAVIFTNPGATFVTQIIGIVSVGVFVSLLSYVVWEILRISIGLRLHWKDEEDGADIAEIGLRAYHISFDDKDK